ncbi:MAG: 3-hydroxyacyl-ACP dehydratase FabZ [Holosporales bacterium]|jgi:3-hydroxyacyl-[acyl-carrier-protein] dehydratase|nr:3-hydroxyacyl-ACP dehydratase FabZ [Holosporales bacterium]
MSEFPATLSSEDIKKLIPHREPFLMIERVEDIQLNTSCVAYKRVLSNEWFFAGHFPGHPIVPGVMIIEAMAQAAGVLAFATLKREEAKCRTDCVFFTTIENARFRKPVGPGDVIRIEVAVNRRRGDRLWKFDGRAIVNGELADDAIFTAMIPENTES